MLSRLMQLAVASAICKIGMRISFSICGTSLCMVLVAMTIKSAPAISRRLAASERILAFPVTSPNHKRVVEDAGIHADRAVDFRIDNSRCADDHAVLGQVPIMATFRHDFCVFEVVAVKCRQIVGIRDVARADFAFVVFHDCVHRNRIVLHELTVDWEHVKLLNVCRSLADAVIHKHIEFQTAFLANLHEPCDVQRFEKCHHRIRSLHPKLKCLCSRCAFRIDFFCHFFAFNYVHRRLYPFRRSFITFMGRLLSPKRFSQ